MELPPGKITAMPEWTRFPGVTEWISKCSTLPSSEHLIYYGSGPFENHLPASVTDTG